jgi:hypothetical protein
MRFLVTGAQADTKFSTKLAIYLGELILPSLTNRADCSLNSVLVTLFEKVAVALLLAV